jgi:hypothetical protein
MTLLRHAELVSASVFFGKCCLIYCICIKREAEGYSKSICRLIDFQAIIDEFYKECGWDEDTGLPKKEKLEELDLDWLLQG